MKCETVAMVKRCGLCNMEIGLGLQHSDSSDELQERVNKRGNVNICYNSSDNKNLLVFPNVRSNYELYCIGIRKKRQAECSNIAPAPG